MSDTNRRFNIIAALFLGILVLSFVFFREHDYFSKVIMFVGFGSLGWVIMEHDYSLLDTKLYLKFLVFSIILLGTGIIFQKLNIENEKLGWTYFMFSFLLLQRVFRFFFKKIVRREPTCNMHGGKFADAVYTFILAMSSILCPILVLEFFF